MYRLRPRDGQLRYRCSGRGSQRRGCGTMVHLEKADAAVHNFMASLDEQVMERKLVPGHNHDAEKEAVKFELRSLDPDAAGYDQQHARLRARLAELRTLPDVPDRWEDVPAGYTYASQWAGLNNQDRAAWMKSAGLSVWADRDRIEIRDRTGFALRTAFT